MWRSRIVRGKRRLRDRKLGGLRFRRQHPLGPYILDFFCVEARLAVELDGSIHDDPAQADYDRERTEWLNEQDVRVLRFTNSAIEQHLDRVRSAIMEQAHPLLEDS